MDRDLPIDGWLLVESRHASIASGVGEKRTLDLAAQLERFVGVLESVGVHPPAELRVPARIYIFPDTNAYSYFRSGDTVGHFYESSRGSFVLLGPDYGARTVLFHEYVHQFMRNQ